MRAAIPALMVTLLLAGCGTGSTEGQAPDAKDEIAVVGSNTVSRRDGEPSLEP